MKIRLASTLLTGALLVGSPALGADDPRENNPTEAGAGALLFQLGGITGTPGSMDGVGVGGLYFLRPRLALRAALGFLSSSDEQDPGGAAAKQETSSLGLSLEGGVEYVLFRSRSVNIWGGGLLQLGVDGHEQKDVQETDSTLFALAGALGADWFFSEHVSLGAEYRLGLQRTSTETKPDGGDKSEQTLTKIGVGSAGLRLGFWW